MGVEDATGEGGVDGLAEHRSEAGHGHHVDRGPRRGRRSAGLGVPLAVEGGPEAAEGRTVDEHRRARPACAATSMRAAPAVHRDHELARGGRRRGSPRGWSRCPTPAPRAAHRGGNPIARRGRRHVRDASSGLRSIDPAGRPARGSVAGPFRSTRATSPDRPATGAGRTSLGPPAQGMPLVTGSIGTARFSPPVSERANLHGAGPVEGIPPASAGTPKERRNASSNSSSDVRSRSQNPQRGESSAARSGTTATRIRAAFAASAPLKESSTARQAAGSTPSSAAVVR